MPKMPDLMIKLLDLDSNLVVDASVRMPDQLAQMAAAAVRGGGTLVLRNADSKMPDQLLEIARVGKGNVTIDLIE